MSLIYTAPAAIPSTNNRRHGIYLGGKSDAKARDKLHRWGITHILNVTPEKEAGIKAGVPNYFEPSSTKTKTLQRSITYRRIPVYDNATTNLLEYAPSIVSFISNALHHGSVLVHCQKGVSRSATALLFYLMKVVGMSLDDGLTLMRRRRGCTSSNNRSDLLYVQPIPAFMEQLKIYERQCMEDQKEKGTEPTPCTVRTIDNDCNVMRKRKIGAVGCAIGPARGPSSSPANNHNAIGPARPDSLPKNDDLSCNSHGKMDKYDTSTHSFKESNHTEPCIPEPKVTKVENKIKKVKCSTEPIVLPSNGINSDHLQTKNKDKRVDNKNCIIGPALPPNL